jgi:hypothetical protein
VDCCKCCCSIYEENAMASPNTEWKVLPHGSVDEVEPGLFTVVGDIPMPLMNLPRRMTVVRLRDGGLLIWSAIALDPNGMAKLEAVGNPAFLVVPNDHHRLDAAAWKTRYPQLQVAAPAGAREKVSEAVHVDTTAPALGDPDVRLVAVPGTREKEAALIVRRPSGTTLVLNDLVGNIRHSSGFGGWLLRVMGFAGEEAHVPGPVKLMIVKDKEALCAQLLEWAAIDDLRRIIVSHGSMIENDPRKVLRELAASLG